MNALIAALLSALAFYFSQGLDDVWWLAWVAPAPLLWLAYGRAKGWQVVLASVVAMAAVSPYVIQCYGTIALALIVTFACLLPVAVLFGRWAHRRAGPYAVLFAFPACWTAMEFLLSLVSPHGSNGSLAYSQVSAPMMIQGASLTGVYGITFLLCLFANAVAMALHRESKAAVGLGLAICLANVAFGAVRLAQPQGERLSVAAIVDEPATNRSWDMKGPRQQATVAEDYARDVRAAAAQGARFIVLPEGGIAYDFKGREEVMAPLEAAVRDTGVHLIVGAVSLKPDADLAWSLAPGKPEVAYAKRHLVPYLETTRFTPGSTSGYLGEGRAVEICKDMDFPGTVRRDARLGVRLMGVPAGDFGKDRWIHGRIAVMRAVEDGFALVRAAYRGMATVSDAQGRLVASQVDLPDGPTIVCAQVPLGAGTTLYARIGDVFPELCVVGVAAVAFLALRPRKTAPTGASAR